MKKMIAVAVLAIGLGALAVPASAAEYYGGDVWTQNEPSRFAPDGVRANGDFMAYIGDDSAAARDIPASREQLFDIKDDAHAQW